MHRIHLNIGSNQGDRKAIIGRAAALIASRLQARRVELSDYVESEPWGYDSPNPFLNRGLLVLTDAFGDAPLTVLDITRTIEREIAPDSPHRRPDGSYTDRRLDIDIIDIDRRPFRHPRLQLPHPRAALRPFVMIPLRALDPAAADFVAATSPPDSPDRYLIAPNNGGELGEVVEKC